MLAGAFAGAISLSAPFARGQQSGASWLRGKTALVTGSTDGLGREVATRLGALGATVIVHGRNEERGAEVVKAIEGNGGKALF